MVRVIFCLIGLLFSQISWAVTSVTATVDKNPVVEQESFVLEITVDDSVPADALNTAPLMQNFIVGRTSVSSQTSMINFKTTRTTRFQTVLIARKAGITMIPALEVEGVKSQPISLTVLDKNNTNAQNQKDLFITSEISSTEIYVQQQLTLTVRLHFAAELKRGSLSEPRLENATIKQIGQDKEQDTILNGRRFRIIERTYAINPQVSGQYTLRSPVFSGEVMIQSARRSNFLSFGETKPVSVVGDPIELNIKPIPDNYQGAWLPSELLTIHQEWQPDVSEFKVGEPITRTITLTAAGLSEEQLPQLTMPMANGLKIYPDQASLHTGMNRNAIVSQKVRNFAIVASTPGEYVLPEIKIPWWNTVTNRYQVASIPEQKIIVKENPDLAVDQQTAFINSVNQKEASEPVTITVVEHSKLQWVFLALWLLTLFAWVISARFSRNKNLVTNDDKQSSTKASSGSAYLGLIAACKQNDGHTALKHIVSWANSLSGNDVEITTLDEAMLFLNSAELNDEIHALQASYFGKNVVQWQGEKLMLIVQQINKQAAMVKQDTAFKLNP